MGHLLFNDFVRTESGPALYSESQYAYANRSNRPLFQEMRALLESWFEEYVTRNPDSADDISARFRSNNDAQHLAALTELHLHHLLCENGFVPQAHPELQDVSTRPEFFALRDGKRQFAVEAVLVYESVADARASKFEANIYDAMNAVASPDFLISVNIVSRDPDTQPKSTSLTRFLQIRIDELEYDQVCKRYEDSEELPQFTYTQGGWTLEFTASPVTEEGRTRRTASSRVIGVMEHGVSMVNIDAAMRDNVLAKSKKYGKLNMPFVIVVNVIRESIFCDDSVVMEALFGRTVVDLTTMGDGSRKSEARSDLNGIWAKPKTGFSNLHVSALMVISGLSSSTVLTAKPILWHHPRATHPLPMSELNVEQRFFDVTSGRLEKHSVR